jgi:hypothetical protein
LLRLTAAAGDQRQPNIQMMKHRDLLV